MLLVFAALAGRKNDGLGIKRVKVKGMYLDWVGRVGWDNVDVMIMNLGVILVYVKAEAVRRLNVEIVLYRIITHIR